MFQMLVVAATVLVAFPVSAAQRAYVSSKGSDVNPCSIAQPCRSFGAAIAQTDAGGEVIVLDSAGYGPVTISKSVTIDAPSGIYAGISVASGSGVVVDATGVTVVLRGLTITGVGGDHGIVLAANARLVVDRCIVTGMEAYGIWIKGPGDVRLIDVRVERSGIGFLANSLVSFPLDVSMDRVAIVANASTGIHFEPNGAGSMRANIADSQISGNDGFGITASGTGAKVLLRTNRNRVSLNRRGIFASGQALVYVIDSMISDNVEDGLDAVYGAAIVMSGNTVTGHPTGVFTNPGSAVYTMKNNIVQDNGFDILNTLPIALPFD
jgi:hypothetical protein